MHVPDIKGVKVREQEYYAGILGRYAGCRLH